MPSPVPLLGAPTASGKSSVALELARRFPIEILTADAMQVYRGMDIGTAKPTYEEQRDVPHHLIDLVTPAQPFSVADWAGAAERTIGEVLERGKVPLVVGGTGFYLRALMKGLPTVPAADPQRQAPIWRELEELGVDALERELQRKSPLDARRAQRNPRRLVRAVEIVRHTGRPPSDFPFTPPRFRFSLAVLLPPLERLRPRIEQRCAQMFASGLVEEVRNLLREYPEQLTAMQAIGYKEVAEVLSRGGSADDARDAVEAATIRYAKRQLTWFRKQPAQLRLTSLAGEALPDLSDWVEGLTE